MCACSSPLGTEEPYSADTGGLSPLKPQNVHYKWLYNNTEHAHVIKLSLTLHGMVRYSRI